MYLAKVCVTREDALHTNDPRINYLVRDERPASAAVGTRAVPVQEVIHVNVRFFFFFVVVVVAGLYDHGHPVDRHRQPIAHLRIPKVVQNDNINDNE